MSCDNYLTVFCDLVARRVLFATEGKEAETWERFAQCLLEHNAHPHGVTSLLLLGNLFSGQSNLWLYFLAALSIYYVGCLFLNKTDVILCTDQILVKTHPLFWIDAAPVSVSQIAGFNVRFRKGRTGWFYDLTYTQGDHQERSLLRFIIKKDQADYLREMLASHYGLEKE